MPELIEKCPELSAEEIVWFVKNKYNIDSSVQRLVSFDDQNFLVTDKRNIRYILKISNTKEKKEFLEAQIAAFKYLNKNCSNYHFPNHIETTDGKIILTIIDDSGTRYFVRLLSYLKGTFWGNLKNHSVNSLQNFGEFLATMNKSLLDFDHPAVHRKFEWDLQNTLYASDRLKYIKSSYKRRIAEYYLLQFETHVLPQLRLLRSSVIHGDANDVNVLIEDELKAGSKMFGKIRSYGDPRGCTVEKVDDGLTVRFDEPLFAPSGGQRLVLYNSLDYVVAGAKMMSFCD